MINKTYDLDNRTKSFALSVRNAISELPLNPLINSDIKQLLRSSGSVAANYVEASDSISTKDFLYRLKLCRKEAKESQLWIELIISQNNETNQNLIKLKEEAIELQRIFGASLRTMSSK